MTSIQVTGASALFDLAALRTPCLLGQLSLPAGTGWLLTQAIAAQGALRVVGLHVSQLLCRDTGGLGK